MSSNVVDEFKSLLHTIGFTEVCVAEIDTPPHVRANFGDLDELNANRSEDVPELRFRYLQVKTVQGEFGIVLEPLPMIDLAQTKLLFPDAFFPDASSEDSSSFAPIERYVFERLFSLLTK